MAREIIHEPLKGILLDFDGTITEPFFDWKAIREEMGIGRMYVLEAMKKADPEDLSRLKEIMDRWERDAIHNAEIREGVKDMLCAIKRLGLSAAVVTNNTSANVEEIALKCSLDLPPIVSRDCGYAKPDREVIEIALSVTGTSPSETILVGDSELDVMAGRGSGLRTVLISADVSGSVDLMPDFHVPGIYQLVNLIEKLVGP